jgi:predicted RNase H-like HicB family nuclease
VKYVVVYEKAPRNWSAYVPDLPGCVAVGDTREEVEREIREAIIFHLQGMLMDSEPIPQPGTWAGEVEIHPEELVVDEAEWLEAGRRAEEIRRQEALAVERKSRRAKGR